MKTQRYVDAAIKCALIEGTQGYEPTFYFLHVWFLSPEQAEHATEMYVQGR